MAWPQPSGLATAYCGLAAAYCGLDAAAGDCGQDVAFCGLEAADPGWQHSFLDLHRGKVCGRKALCDELRTLGAGRQAAGGTQEF